MTDQAAAMPRSGAAHRLGALDAARLIARGELTSEQLVSDCLARIAERDGAVQAWAFVDPEAALAEARRADRSQPLGPLHGVPVGIKDVIDTADMPTSYGSPIYAGHRPKADAAAVALLRRAGCVILGKTETTEFANVFPSRTRNPRNLAHTPGGSSAGSAAAVADDMVPLALGTQTGGSTIRPAAFCGAVGYKPTIASVSRAGLKLLAESLDTIGVFARSPADALACMSVLSGRPLPDPDHAPERPLRIGLCRMSWWEKAEACQRGEVERAAGRLAGTGAQIAEFVIEDDQRLLAAHAAIMDFESARCLAWEQEHHADRLSPALAARLKAGRQCTRAAYDEAREVQRLVMRQLAGQMEGFDLLLTPPAGGEAPAGFATTGDSLFNRVWTMLGVPAVTIPTGTGPNGLPLGIQLVGRAEGDNALIQAAGRIARDLA